MAAHISITTPTTSRRSLLTAAPAALMLTGAGIVTADAAPSPDAELIRLCAIAVERNAEVDSHNDKYEGDEPDDLLQWMRGVVAEIHTMVEHIANIRAVTLEGMKAKARVMIIYECRNSDGETMWCNHDELIGWSLVIDLLGEGNPTAPMAG